MQKTKIDWCDATWNPVVGCRGTCPYCYARRIAHRFHRNFIPHWEEHNFNRAMPRQPARIFVNSMSDVSQWHAEWWNRVIRKIEQYPQHTFLFLTKKTSFYDGIRVPRNCLCGVTATTRLVVAKALNHSPDFLSIEPILEPIDPETLCGHGLSWIILGAETGRRKERVIPPAEWIAPFLSLPIPLFMKHNLPWTGEWRREFPTPGKQG